MKQSQGCTFLLTQQHESAKPTRVFLLHGEGICQPGSKSRPFTPSQAGVSITSIADGTKVAWSFAVFLQVISHVRCPQVLPTDLAWNFIFMAREVRAQPVTGGKGSVARLWTAADAH